MSLRVHALSKEKIGLLHTIITFKGTGEQLRKPKAQTKEWKGYDKALLTRIRRKK